MNDCPTCGAPLVWSFDHARMWCCIFGTHAEQRQPAPLVLIASGLATDPRHTAQREAMRRLRDVS